MLWLDKFDGPVLVHNMDTLHASGPKGPSRRAFLSAAAVTAVAAPIVAQAAPAHAAPAGLASAQTTGKFDPALRALIKQIDPDRIQATMVFERIT